MAQVSVGKLLPNLKVTLGNDSTEVQTSAEKNDNSPEKLAEDAEGTPNVEIVRSWMESLQNPKVYKNKSGGFTTGLDLISEENTELLCKRAERFGLEKEESFLAPNINELYESMGITTGNRNSGKLKNLRLDTLHMRGVNDLSTNEIFGYFQDYGPASVEWINDLSCNVVWLDEASCARALLGVSKPLSDVKASTVEEPHQSAGSNRSSESSIEQELSTDRQDEIKVESKMEVDEDLPQTEEGKQSEKDCSIPVPPGHWRIGTHHPKAKFILLRFATKDDKKLPGAEKRSDYYKKYGNPNYGGLKGLISSSRKRKMQAASTRRAIEVQGSQTTEIPVQKVLNLRPPRMRMYADDEEQKSRKFRASECVKGSVHSRLGSKYTQDDLCHLGSSYQGDRKRNSDNDLHTSYHGGRKRNADSDLRSSYQGDKKRNSDSDLRSKLKRIRRGDNKHCSPLCLSD